DGRNEKQIQPGMIAEEDRKRRHAIVVEMADIEGESAHREQKDHDEDIGEWRREIGGKFAFENSQDLFHAAAPARSRTRCVSCVVRARKTSSRRPASAYSSFTSHFCAAASALTFSMISSCPLGKTVRVATLSWRAPSST